KELFSDFNKIYLSLNSSQNIEADSFVRIDDDFCEIGPISGLYKGLLESDSDYIFTLPCDVPNLTKDFIAYISDFASPSYDAFIVRDKNGFVHPLLGIYSKNCLDAMKVGIDSGDYKIMNFLRQLNIKYIDLKYTIFDDEHILKNINTPEDYNSLFHREKTKFFAVSGVKNSGKTTLITKLIQKFVSEGYRVGTIKHDGHDFEMDNLDSDTDKHIKSGAHGTLIFSRSKFMFLEKNPEQPLEFYSDYFKNYDLILLEGFKNSNYPKLEIIRDEISDKSVSNRENLKFIVTNHKNIFDKDELEVIELDDTDSIFKKIVSILNVRL
ncbi:MAG: molybdopterin-guanine dinucleotide biosynthesis protein B, partial [Cetobacterium sp.]